MAILVTDKQSSENKYLHRDFHLIMNRAIQHIGDNYGEKGVETYIKEYAKRYFSAMTLEEIKNYLVELYEKEEASDKIEVTLTDKELAVKIVSCPAVEYILSKGDKPATYYVHTAKTLYAQIAETSGLKFEFGAYDEATGACDFTFKKKRCCCKKA